MSNYNKISTSPIFPLISGHYSEPSSKTGPSSGRCDSGISDVFFSGPMDAERDGGLVSHGFIRPKFVLQGSLDDVENGDSGIMMGEDETFTDSARSHRNPQAVDEEMVSSPVPTRSRSNSPKSMSDEETPKTTTQERSNNGKRKAPRKPKRIVPSNSVGSESARPNPKMNTRSSSAHALSSTSAESTSSSEISTTKCTISHRSPSPPLPPVSSTAPGNAYTYSAYGMSASYTSQRVPPIASDFSMSMQNLSKYMDLFIPDKEGDT